MEGFLQQSSSAIVTVLMIDEADHITGLPGLTLTIEISKSFSAFAVITPFVIDRGYGWYELFLTSSHTSNLGDLVMHVTAAGADPTDLKWQITPGAPFALTVASIVSGVWNALQENFLLSGSFGWQIQEMEGRVDAFVDAPISGVPTAVQNADALLKRDLSAVTGEASRSPINALRALRNKTAVAAGVLTVTKENDSTVAWTAAVVTTPGAEPITSVDPT